MLELKKISKTYNTNNFKQTALNNVSISFREQEFAAILGPSGSGKTTLLNIIGGLDKYDSGDLIINNVSTKLYKDRDWDTYRNYRVGFVFQNYNLISHQSILSNVELALTLGGVSKEERKANIQGVYKLIDSKNIKNKNIILIDDVYTTGSTVNECARVLQQARPKSISVLVIAKD